MTIDRKEAYPLARNSSESKQISASATHLVLEVALGLPLPAGRVHLPAELGLVALRAAVAHHRHLSRQGQASLRRWGIESPECALTLAISTQNVHGTEMGQGSITW
jgi:hypothetical protein